MDTSHTDDGRPTGAASTDDRALVEAAQAGDRAALDTLLRRHYDRVTAVCRRILHNDADAADATQDALMAAVRGLSRFDGNAAFSTWLYRIATNTCLDQLRRRKRRPTTPLEQLLNVGELLETRPFDSAVVDQMAVQQALERLPDDFRIAVVLRDVADLDYADIADTLGIPIGTVRSRIARGRAVLAKELGNQTGPDDRQTDHS